MNNFSKYCSNVWLAKTTDNFKKLDEIILTNKYGKESPRIIYNLIYSKDGSNYYSIALPNDVVPYAQRKAEKYEGYAQNAENKSVDFYNKSNIHKDFLSLAEPIKVGHHSEGRHRRIIESSQNNMQKCVEASDKASRYEDKAEYWKEKAKTINLSVPESLDYFLHKIEVTSKIHMEIKSGLKRKDHDYSLSYAKTDSNEAKKNYELALKLWG